MLRVSSSGPWHAASGFGCREAVKRFTGGGGRESRSPLGGSRRALELDDVAVRILEVHRRAHSERAVAVSDVAGLDVVVLEVGLQCRFVEPSELETEMVDVLGVRPGWPPAGTTQRRVDRDQIDQRAARPELDQAERIHPPFFRAAERISVETQRPVQVGDTHDHVVEACDFERAFHAARVGQAVVSAGGAGPRRMCAAARPHSVG